MKATRRHELQHNVLDIELAKTVEFLKKRGRLIVWTLVIIVPLVVLTSWYATSRRRNRAEWQARYAELKAAQGSESARPLEALLRGFGEISEQRKVPSLAAMACVDAGDIYAWKLFETKTDTERQNITKQARECYKKAIEQFPEQSATVAKAHLGLGKLAEGERDFDEAKKQYELALAVPGVSGLDVARQADGGLKMLGLYGEPVRMATTAPAPPATMPAGSRPASSAETRPAETAHSRPAPTSTTAAATTAP